MFWNRSKSSTALIISAVQFKVTDTTIEVDFVSSSQEETESSSFALQPPFEFVVCLRFDALPNGALTRAQAQTNLGRRSRCVSRIGLESRGVRFELYAPLGQAICGLELGITPELGTPSIKFRVCVYFFIQK
jgi:hypothetical protein